MKTYFSTMKQYSWVLLACIVIAMLGGLALAKAQHVSYQVSSIMYVDLGAPGTTFSATGASTASAADSLTAAANYASEMVTRGVMQYIYQTDPEIAKHGYSVDDLLADIQAVASTTSPTITITAIAFTPGEGVLLANAVSNGFQSFIQNRFQSHLDMLRKNLQDQLAVYQKQSSDLEKQIEQLNNPADSRTSLWTADRDDAIHNIDTLQGQLQTLPTAIQSDIYVVQQAEKSDAVPSSKTSVVIATTGGVGLLLGTVIMLILVFLDNRLRNEEQVKEKLGLAYIGSLSSSKELEKIPARISGGTAQEVVDICANLRLTGVLAGKGRAPHGAVLLISSPKSSEGKTTLAAAMAAVFAQSESSVVVVDGNLHRPSTHLAFGMKPVGIGLSRLLQSRGEERVDDAVMRSDIPGVWLLPAGMPLNESAFLIEQKMPAVLARLREKTDLVIIDGPPLLSGADASLLAGMADGVALIFDARYEKLPQLLRSKELLKSLARKPAGVVVNRISGRIRKSKGYFATAVSTEANNAAPVLPSIPASNGKVHADWHRVEPVAPPLTDMSSLSMPQPPESVPTVPPTPSSAPAPGRAMPNLPPPDSGMKREVPASPRPSPYRPAAVPPPPLRPGKSE